MPVKIQIIQRWSWYLKKSFISLMKDSAKNYSGTVHAYVIGPNSSTKSFSILRLSMMKV